MNKNNIISASNCKTKEEVFRLIASKVKEKNSKVDEEQVIQGFINREGESSTGFENGFAIPHTKVDNLEDNEVYVIRDLSIDWPSMDGEKTEVAIAILVDSNSPKEHLVILTKISRNLIDESFQEILKNGTEEEIAKAMDFDEEKPKEEATNQNNQEKGFIIGVTACTTGIAHTYMAAESLEKKAKELGYEVKIETRGQGGVGNFLTKEDIERAKGVIVAVDVEVPIERFAGKKMVKVPVKDGISRPEELINEINTAKEYKGTSTQTEESNDEEKVSIYSSLMTGVTYMLPFVVAGGIFTAFRFLFGTEADIKAGVDPIIQNLQLGNFFGDIGGILFGLMLPVLAGYIAYSIGNRAALMPGFLAGMMASNQGSGFLGALLGGFIAGYAAKFLFDQLPKVPKSLQGSYQILFLPLLGALIIGIFMSLFGIPIKFLNDSLTNGLQGLQDASPILLGALIGAMMASDMGGPINKAAYVTGTLLLAEGNQTFMAAVMAGGMVPPLSIAISTLMYKNKFTAEEREAGKTNFIMGLSFVTEGAIPFAAKDPKVVIPSLMIGSAIASSLTMIFQVQLPAPHGGIFVFPLITHVWAYIFSIAVGSFAGAIVLGTLKKSISQK